ncbi:RimJ/RimL family protein N-acetyltransferase [Salinibacterium amurskyense]|uniref:RimJ/RimL family protein N-acetyltransferase n=1 Tax=Salinibacterium amurskyense TaxID=205941 RepID=A0A2M9D5M6_9MICO|nr:GNAT family protein [Salinibacterium amurskyense]PJJ80999.1 RimJ/RimL family protein N-acetyltransferase [Salinibacterium amurskyense]RLQ83034.1 N-acetyltransferase [Salinibacterium amurskyense]GHD81858.1 N-acetyltransferase [Salinibacterium amurskyense]
MKPYDSLAPIATERLVLRRLTLSNNDIDDLHAQQSNPELTTYMLYDPRDRATVIEKIQEWTGNEVLAATNDYLQLAIDLLDAVPPKAVQSTAITDANGSAAATTTSASASPGATTEPPSERRTVMIGTLYFKLTNAEQSTAEIGWALHPNFQGKGYAREAASALLDVAFGEMELHRVTALLDPRNGDSIRLCEALGMRREAHFVEDLWFRGAWEDTYSYGILAREWASRSRR